VTEAEHRALVVDFLKLLHSRGYLAACDGNISVRLGPGRVLVTPSGVHKGFLGVDDLLVTDAEGRVLEGRGCPTGELAMHLTSLHRRPDINAVVHAHPPTCIALSLIPGVTLNGFLPEVILSVGEVPIIPYATPVTAAMAIALHGFVDRCDAMILERHGTLTLGRTLLDAYAFTERLEHAALVLWRARTLGRPKRLSLSEEQTLKGMYERARAASAEVGR
jgi:L-fuculose-phosphate aldolase